MKLTGPEILKRIESGEIVIDPFRPEQMNPNSYNLRLDRKLVVYDRHPLVDEKTDISMARVLANGDRRLNDKRVANGFDPVYRNPHLELQDWFDVLDMREDNPTYDLIIPDSGLVLVPGRLYLAHTVEYTETHTTVPCIEGRSSVGRLGISIHATAGFGDVGFCGTWTLEISVVEPVRIYPDVQFCQIIYEEAHGEIVKYKSAKYQGQRTPKPSGLWQELQKQGG